MRPLDKSEMVLGGALAAVAVTAGLGYAVARQRKQAPKYAPIRKVTAKKPKKGSVKKVEVKPQVANPASSERPPSTAPITGMVVGVGKELGSNRWADVEEMARRKNFRPYYFKGDPPGAVKLKLVDLDRILAWYAYGGRSNCKRKPKGASGCREMPQLAPLIGRGSGLKSYTKAVSKAVKMASKIAVPAATGTVSPDLLAQAPGLVDELEGVILELFTGWRNRGNAASKIVVAITDSYLVPIVRHPFNAHAVRNGRLDLRAVYKADPQTFADLGKPGNARPMIWIP